MMPISHLFLAVLIAVVWGVNFLFVKLALQEIPALLLCALRFTLASIPAIFFIKPPRISFKIIVLYGLLMFALQFSFFFIGMQAGMTAGMGSLLMQTQVFFSMFFAMLFLGERISLWQTIGALVAFSGIGVVALHFDNTISLTGFLFIIGGAVTWGIGNLITRKNKDIDMIGLVVWGSLAAIPPLFLMSFLIEGSEKMMEAIYHTSWQGVFSLFYIVYISTLIGYCAWNWLLSRYSVITIVPFTLLIPVIGILSSVIFLGEPFQSWKLFAVLLVMTGLFINLAGARLLADKTSKKAKSMIQGTS